MQMRVPWLLEVGGFAASYGIVRVKCCAVLIAVLNVLWFWLRMQGATPPTHLVQGASPRTACLGSEWVWPA
jgi:hypothetical protein